MLETVKEAEAESAVTGDSRKSVKEASESHRDENVASMVTMDTGDVKTSGEARMAATLALEASPAEVGRVK